MGPSGGAVVRAVTTAARCPAIRVDARRLQMRVRAAPARDELRPTKSPPQLSKRSDFPVMTCEFDLPAGTTSAAIRGRALKLPRAEPRRIVVIGDTGCRLKAADAAFQACDDPTAYPFARITSQAAAWKPDLVVHVGDYLYRENPCPKTVPGCSGSPWGYGWDSWSADFFAPARPLLLAAPWIMVRGNHESCNRAGQGWWRFLDPRRLEPGRDCNDPRNDALGDYQGAFLVPLGTDSQIVVMDIATSGEKAIAPGDPRFDQLGGIWNFLKKTGANGKFTIAAGHYPLLALAAKAHDGVVGIGGESAGIASVFQAQDGPLVPPGIDLLLAGHVHLWEQVGFSRDYPTQLVAGFSGTQEDVATLPAGLPIAVTPVAGASVAHFASWTHGFGWMSLEKLGSRQWKVLVHSVTGGIVDQCQITGSTSICGLGAKRESAGAPSARQARRESSQAGHRLR
ncbi:MAG: metallophosphoesterase [Sphingomicrobium sp.]